MKQVLAYLAGAFLLVNTVQCGDVPFWDEMVECAQDTGISPDQMMSMISAKDEKLGCINACVLEKIGGMTNDKLSIDGLMESLEKHKTKLNNYDKAKADIQTCYDDAMSSGDLPKCESAGKFSFCMHEHMRQG